MGERLVGSCTCTVAAAEPGLPMLPPECRYTVSPLIVVHPVWAKTVIRRGCGLASWMAATMWSCTRWIG